MFSPLLNTAIKRSSSPSDVRAVSFVSPSPKTAEALKLPEMRISLFLLRVVPIAESFSVPPALTALTRFPFSSNFATKISNPPAEVRDVSLSSPFPNVALPEK